MSEPTQEGRFSGVYDNPDGEAAKAQKAKAKEQAIELIKTSDSFVVFFVRKENKEGKEGKAFGCVSGIAVQNVPYIVEAINEYVMTLKKQVMDSIFSKFKDFFNDDDSKD